MKVIDNTVDFEPSVENAMDVVEIRKQYNSSPEWAYVALLKRVEVLENKVEQLSKPKPRGRPRKVKANVD